MTRPVADVLAELEAVVTHLAPSEVPETLGRLELVKVRLVERATAAPESVAPSAPERLLKVHEAAARCGMGEDWLYRNARTLPFTRRVGRALRFSEAGLVRWMASRRQ